MISQLPLNKTEKQSLVTQLFFFGLIFFSPELKMQKLLTNHMLPRKVFVELSFQLMYMYVHAILLFKKKMWKLKC